jgi:hypothetical protein
MTQVQRSGNMAVESPELVAEKILEAIQSEAAEVYTNNTKPGI